MLRFCLRFHIFNENNVKNNVIRMRINELISDANYKPLGFLAKLQFPQPFGANDGKFRISKYLTWAT